MLSHVYADHRITFTRGATYDAQGNRDAADGFTTPKHEKRAGQDRMGARPPRWRTSARHLWNGAKAPLKRQSQVQSSRAASAPRRLMLSTDDATADMYNLFPAIGAVNALRSNFNYAMLAGEPATFGSCVLAKKSAATKLEPPARAVGQIARTYFYMQDSFYSRYHMSSQQEQLMKAWDKQYPVDKWECTRAKRTRSLRQ